jgi:hypothetical protein
MSPAPRTSRDIPSVDPAKTFEFIETSANLYKKSVERMAEIQNRTIDCALQQNREAIELWKQMTEKLPWAPRLYFFDDATGTLERVAEAQKAAINAAVDQTRSFTDMIKERTVLASKAAESLSRFSQQSFERTVAAQKVAAEATFNETKSAFENARDRFSVPGSEVFAESLQRGVDAVIDAQKELLQTASRRWTSVAEPVVAAS